MEFDKNRYLIEMKGMIDTALDRLQSERPDFEIYSMNIWTDPNAAVSSINFDSKVNSERHVAESNEWNKKYYDKYTAAGDFEQAKLFEPITRNRNPADFELRNFKELSNSSMPENWDEVSEGSCWDILEPCLKEVGEYALNKIRTVNVHPDFEMSVNGRQDWYEFTWVLT